MGKLSQRVFTRKKKLTGTIDDYPLVKLTTLDWVSHSEWMHIDKARRLKPDKCFAVGYHSRVLFTIILPSRRGLFSRYL